MDTNKAMKDALDRPSIKKKVNPNNLRQMRKRLKDGKMSLDKQVKFLLEHGYFIRSEINWGKPQRTKKIPKEAMEAAAQIAGAAMVHSNELVPLCSICKIPFPCNCGKPENAIL